MRGSVDSALSQCRVTAKTSADERRSLFSLETLAMEFLSVKNIRALMPGCEAKATGSSSEQRIRRGVVACDLREAPCDRSERMWRPDECRPLIRGSIHR